MKRTLFLLIFILLIFSCQDVGYLFQEDELWELSTIYPGQWLDEEASLTLEIPEESELTSDDQIVLRLVKQDLSIYTYDGPIGGLEDFRLPPDIPLGEYMLDYSIKRDERILQSNQVPFYHYSGNYGLGDIKLFPPLITPLSTVTARVEISEVQDSSDPWLVWTLGEEVIESSPLSQNGGFTSFEVPPTTGVYPLKVDIFPVEPLLWQGHSPYQVSTEIYVSWGESSSLVRMEDDDYPLFYIFDGTRDIYAPREGLVNLKLLDRYKVEQTLSGSTTGAGFLEDSSMRFYGAAFPVDQGQLLSHSQNFYIQIPKTADYQRRTIFSTQSPGDDLSLSLISLEDQLIASLGLGSSFQRLVLDLKNEYFDRPLLVTLSLRIEGDQWSLLAYLDGEFQKSITWEQPVKEMLAVGETYWGAKAGASGFQGMLFGWMIYCQEEDSQYIDQQDIFAFTKELYWGDNVVLAQGFDTMTLQGAHSVEEPIIPKESKIFIPPEEILTFDALPIKQGKLYFDIQGLSNLDDSVYVRFNQGQWALLPLSNGLGELKIKDQRILRLNEDEVWVPFKQIEESEEELTMEMEFRSNEGLFIDSLFIHQ